jgi:hypothetical protein
MKKWAGVIVVGFVAVGLAGWYFRGHLRASVSVAPQPAEAVVQQKPAIQQKPDVLYTWVDKDGVTHYEQEPGRGERVVFDGTRITPLVTPPPSPRRKIETTTNTVKERTGEGLHKLRNELEAGAQRMREARAAASPDI